jgi:TolA-binding protein
LGRAGDAVDRWEAVVARDPTSEIGAKAWARAGDVYFRAEKHDDAKRCFAGLLEHVQQGEAAARATLRIAQCEYNAGRDAEALRGYADVIERFGDQAAAKEAAHGMELALYRLGRQDGGGAVLAELVERFPASSFAADAQFQIGMRAYEGEDWPAAAEAFRRVVTQFPSFSAADRAHFLMGESYEKADAKREASDAYAQFVHFFPNSELLPAVQFRLGSLRFAEGAFMQAAIDFTAVLDRKVSDETARAARYNLALCQIQLGSTEEARATLERFRSEQTVGDARAADVAYRLGDLHERAGRAKEAIAEYQAAIAMKPDPALTGELQYRIGSCRETLGDPDGAVRAFRGAVAASPKGHAYRLSSLARLAALYESSERFKDAVAAYQELIKGSDDAELVAAAKERVDQLQASQRR